MYSINYTASAVGNSVAFSSYLEEYARLSDLKAFATRYVPSAKNASFSVQLVNGGKDDQNSNEDSGKSFFPLLNLFLQSGLQKLSCVTPNNSI